MRVLALDIGSVRVGIAVSDASARVATPVCVLPASEVLGHAKSFQRVLDDWEPNVLLCGLPTSLDGEEGPQAHNIRSFARTVGEHCNLAVHFADERLSSVQAKRSLREKGLSERKMRGKVDMIAASLFLQAWLDQQNAAQLIPQNAAHRAQESAHKCTVHCSQRSLENTAHSVQESACENAAHNTLLGPARNTTHRAPRNA